MKFISKKKYLILISSLFFFCIHYFIIFSQTIKKNNEIVHSGNSITSTILEEIKIDSLKVFVRELSGDKFVMLNGIRDTIRSRNKFQQGNEKAAIYIKQKLESYGLPTFFQEFNSPTGKNVYAIQTGSKSPNQKYIICAHYDDKPDGVIAPGADDNASGTAAVIEAARVLSKYTTDYTIVYALWDEEEFGLVGSDYFARQPGNSNERILGVLNLDMIGYDINNDSLCVIHTNGTPNSNALANILSSVNSTLNINLNVTINNNGTSGSDHASFWKVGYPAVLLIENFDNLNDRNAFYHKTGDNIYAFNMRYFEKCSKLAIMGLSKLASLSQTVVVNYRGTTLQEIHLYQNYPNPFNPKTLISFDIPKNSNVELKIFSPIGENISTLIQNSLQAGNYSFEWDGKNFSSGLYFYQLKVGNFTQTKKFILIK